MEEVKVKVEEVIELEGEAARSLEPYSRHQNQSLHQLRRFGNTVGVNNVGLRHHCNLTWPPNGLQLCLLCLQARAQWSPLLSHLSYLSHLFPGAL